VSRRRPRAGRGGWGRTDQAAYEAGPELADVRIDFRAGLHEMPATLLAGLLARRLESSRLRAAGQPCIPGPDQLTRNSGFGETQYS
jgi:hypothetical protein